jgi:hypothetical protein
MACKNRAQTFIFADRLQLYWYGLDPKACNASIYWFAVLVVIVQYLQLITLFVW